MTDRDEQGRETAAPGERNTSLTAAILRISASLDVGTVLQEVVDSARALTRARYGIIATLDEAGEPQDYVISGATPDERRLLEEWPPALRFFEHLRDLPGPLRLADLPAYIRALGYSPDLLLSKTMQATPMRHRGVHVGAFFLGEKEGGQAFTPEDEETLALFASQAAGPRSSTPAHTATRSERGPTSRPWWRPRRSVSWCSTRGPARRCRSTGRRGGWPKRCARRAPPWSSCWKC